MILSHQLYWLPSTYFCHDCVGIAQNFVHHLIKQWISNPPIFTSTFYSQRSRPNFSRNVQPVNKMRTGCTLKFEPFGIPNFICMPNRFCLSWNGWWRKFLWKQFKLQHIGMKRKMTKPISNLNLIPLCLKLVGYSSHSRIVVVGFPSRSKKLQVLLGIFYYFHPV